MTTAYTQARTEPKICAQSWAALASVGILVHFVHEIFVVSGPTRGLELAAGAVFVSATIATTAQWYRMKRGTRRGVAAVLGVLWTVAASEHAIAAFNGGSAVDFTGLLTFAGGLILVFAAYWDYRRPMETP